MELMTGSTATRTVIETRKMLVEMVVCVHYYWNPGVFEYPETGNVVIGFINDHGKHTSDTDVLVMKMSKLFGISVDDAYKKFNNITTQLMNEIGFDWKKYVGCGVVEQEVIDRARDEIKHCVEIYESTNHRRLDLYFISKLLGIDEVVLNAAFEEAGE